MYSYSIVSVSTVQDDAQTNRQLYLDVLWMVSCQSKLNSKTRDVTSDGNERMLSSHMAKTMALMLLDLVAPDVMYNGIPWPEQEFMRVTIERLELHYMYEV